MAKLVFLGRLREAAGAAERSADFPQDVATAADLVAWLCADDPVLGEALADPAVRVARNQDIIALGDPVAANDEIAFLPPMSGG